jgi:hypothetical protein
MVKTGLDTGEEIFDEEISIVISTLNDYSAHAG